MKTSEQTVKQIERFYRKVADKFPADKEAERMTDIHVRVSQDSGEMLAFDDEDEEITRCVVEEWIDAKSETFYQDIVPVLRKCIERQKGLVDNMSIMKPYSFVLEDDDKENIAELRLCDDETIIIDETELMEGLDKELDAFFDDLMKE